MRRRKNKESASLARPSPDSAPDSAPAKAAHEPGSSPPTAVVGVGSSSGGLAPLRTLLSGLSTGHGLAVVLVQHMQAQSDGLLVSLIADQTPLNASMGTALAMIYLRRSLNQRITETQFS